MQLIKPIALWVSPRYSAEAQEKIEKKESLQPKQQKRSGSHKPPWPLLKSS